MAAGYMLSSNLERSHGRKAQSNDKSRMFKVTNLFLQDKSCRMIMRRIKFFLIFLLGFSFQGEAKNLLLFTIDSCRADRFGKDLTPSIDEWAKSGAVFTNAYSTSAWTAPGLVSILSGLYPPIHGVNNRDHTGPEALFTIPKLFQEKGYQVPNLNFFTFAPYYSHLGLPPIDRKYFGETEGEALLNWLRENASNEKPPFFVWFHSTIVHQPYRPSPEALPDTRENLEKSPGIKAVLNGAIVPYGSTVFQPEDKPVLDILYNEEIRRVDWLFRQVLEILEKADQTEQTLIILTADHGEELLDHGFVGHASTSLNAKLYEELVHIPLILSWPGKIQPGQLVQTPVSQVDIFPTIADLMALSPETDFDGMNLFEVSNNRSIYFESVVAGNQTPKDRTGEWIRAIRKGRFKYISNGKLFDLLLDPGERQDLSSGEPATVDRLQTELSNWMEESLLRRDKLFPRQAENKIALDNSNSCPNIYTPGNQSVLDYDIHTGALLFDWSGDMETTYLVEYDIGVGDHHVAGTYEVQGNHQIMGPLPRELWTDLKAWNPFRIRISPKTEPRCWSQWVEFRF